MYDFFPIKYFLEYDSQFLIIKISCKLIWIPSIYFSYIGCCTNAKKPITSYCLRDLSKLAKIMELAHLEDANGLLLWNFLNFELIL